ncbi:MAG: DUF6259 domain-containing protein [Armatimonadota bacterium]
MIRMINIFPILMSAFILLFSQGSSAGRLPHSVALSSGELNVQFDINDGKLALTSISGKGIGNWLGSPAGGALWRIAFMSDTGAVIDTGSSAQAVSDLSGTANDAVFTWKTPLADKSAVVRMAVSCPKGERLSRWSLKADLPEGWKVVRCDFPLIPNIGLKPGLKMSAPAGWGLEYDMKPGTKYDATYPSALAGMQFVSLYGSGKGLYIGAHDKRGNHKYFNINAREDGIDYLCMNWPAIPAKSGGTYKVPFDAYIGVFDGDYYDAAQIYREFTFSAVWGKAGPVSKRSIPAWMKETDLWLMSEGDIQTNMDLRESARNFFGIPISFHWYRWHQIPHDVLYPDYFPYKDGFPEAVKAFQRDDYHVMPYINGRLTDPNSNFWKSEYGPSAAASQENGSLYPEVYIPNVTLNVMCPYSPVWQQEIAGLADRLKKEIGVNGVYIDQISAAGPVRCYNPVHGHPLGAGSMWVDGYRKMLSGAMSKLAKDDILTSEENAECWIDQLDGQLMANTPTGDQKLIPLFPSVYSGRSLTFGFQYMAWDDYQRSVPFRAKMGRAFVWGSQPGWVHFGRIMAPENVKEAEYLRSLARCRRFGRQYLTYGQFLGMLSVSGVKDRIESDATKSMGGTYSIDLPAVLASSWLGQDGTVGIALANMSDKPQKAGLILPLNKAGIKPGETFTLKTFGTEGLIHTIRSGKQDFSISIPERGAFILSISRDK